MAQLPFVTVLVAALLCGVPADAQDDDYARQVAQERRQAELEAPQLAEVLGLKPGMTVADIGTGGGAMAMVLGRLVGSGRVYATDITQRSLTITREYAKTEGLTNITVVEGGAASTNLPSECCEVLFLRNVYHHITEPAAFNKSLYATAKAGARLAIIDASPAKGSELPSGVPVNRGGHGVPATVVIDELTAAGFVHVRTIQGWPPGDKYPTVFLALFEKKQGSSGTVSIEEDGASSLRHRQFPQACPPIPATDSRAEFRRSRRVDCGLASTADAASTRGRSSMRGSGRVCTTISRALLAWCSDAMSRSTTSGRPFDRSTEKFAWRRGSHPAAIVLFSEDQIETGRREASNVPPRSPIFD